MSASAEIRAIQESLAALSQVVSTLAESPAKKAPAKASPKGTTRGATRGKAKAKPSVGVGVLSMAQAWACDTRSVGQERPDWAREDKPASAKQLYALNTQGFFSQLA